MKRRVEIKMWAYVLTEEDNFAPLAEEMQRALLRLTGVQLTSVRVTGDSGVVLFDDNIGATA